MTLGTHVTPNPALQPTAGKRRLPVPSSLRYSAAAELVRWAANSARGCS